MALATAFAAVADTNFAFNGPVNLTEPMLHHLVEPRKAVNLCGDWQLAVFERPVKVDFSTGTEVYELGKFDLDPEKLNWSKSVKVPYVVPCGTNPKLLYLFRKRVNLTAAEARRQVRLVFEQVGDHAELYVNGKYVADEILTGLDWDVNISDFAKEGENLIEVRIAYDVPFRKWCDYVSIQTWATGRHCGIALPVHLEISDPVFVDHAFVTTQVIPERKFRADVVLTNATDKTVTAEVAVNVKDWEKPLVKKISLKAHEMSTAVVERAWADVKLWSPASPKLYDMDVSLAERATPLKEGSDAGAPLAPRAVDAYRVRFGFRDLQFRQKQVSMNGVPFMNYRVTTGLNPNQETEAAFRETLRRLRRRGIVGLRSFLPCAFKRTAWMCDEEGLTVSPCLMAGGGAGGKSDFFFKVYHPSQVRRAIRQQRNSPSVICWGLGNEFGGTYGGSDERTINSEASVGAYATALDPTRPWCYYGECEVGVPLNKAGGPCPIRSVHYATAPCSSWGPVPYLNRWLLHDLWGWQGAWDRTKPLVCSEDLYHGLLDACRGMAKWSGDHYCSRDGYYRAWWQTLRWYAQGNTLGGLSGWEPWCTYVEAEKNPLFDLWGAPIPDYLLFVYEFESNLFSGEKFARTFYACNRWFTDIDAALMCELRADGKVLAKWTEDAKLKAGEFRKYALEREAPKVTKNETMTFKMRLVTSDGRELAKEEHPFFVFPKLGKVAAPAVAQLKGEESDYEDLVEPALGRFADVEKAIASGAKRIFCDRPLTPAEGEKLSDFVAGGGTVMLVGATPESWSPLKVHKANVCFGWIRNGDVFGDLDERTYHMWGPHDNNPWNWTVSAFAMGKPTGVDCNVWLDCGTGWGVKDALALRLTVGKGSWILCTLPLAEKAEDEPCALWTLKLLVERLAAEQPKFDRKLFVTPAKGDYAKLFDDFGMPVAEKPGSPESTVLVVDASKGLDAKEVDAFARAGGTVWVMEPQSAAAIPSDWPIAAIERKQKVWCPKMGEDGSDYFSFVWRTTNRGLMAGVSNESLLWYGDPNALAAYWQHIDLGYCAPPQTESDFALGMRLAPKPGAKEVVKYVEPCGLVEFPLGKGRVIVSTLRMLRLKMRQSAGIEELLRQMANNCGVRTLPETLRKPPAWHTVDISQSATSGFCRWDASGWTRWNKKCTRAPKDGGIGWFGNGDDMRHFPVEQTGGARGNEDFPTEPLSLCGAKFKIINPMGKQTANRSCVMVNPGRSVAFALGSPKAGVRCRRIWVLGAAERGDLERLENTNEGGDDLMDGMLADEGGKGADEQGLGLRVSFDLGQQKSGSCAFTFKSGRHFGGYADAEALRNGGKTAWTGPTQSGKPGALYAFWYDIPEKFRDAPVKEIRFDNRLKTAFMIVSVTAEE